MRWSIVVLAGAGLVALSLGAGFAAEGVLGWDPQDATNYDDRAEASDPEAQDRIREGRRDMVLTGFGFTITGLAAWTAALILTARSPPRDASTKA